MCSNLVVLQLTSLSEKIPAIMSCANVLIVNRVLRKKFIYRVLPIGKRQRPSCVQTNVVEFLCLQNDCRESNWHVRYIIFVRINSFQRFYFDRRASEHESQVKTNVRSVSFCPICIHYRYANRYTKCTKMYYESNKRSSASNNKFVYVMHLEFSLCEIG